MFCNPSLKMSFLLFCSFVLFNMGNKNKSEIVMIDKTTGSLVFNGGSF